jgi:hypothetical protein
MLREMLQILQMNSRFAVPWILKRKIRHKMNLRIVITRRYQFYRYCVPLFNGSSSGTFVGFCFCNNFCNALSLVFFSILHHMDMYKRNIVLPSVSWFLFTGYFDIKPCNYNREFLLIVIIFRHKTFLVISFVLI